MDCACSNCSLKSHGSVCCGPGIGSGTERLCAIGTMQQSAAAMANVAGRTVNFDNVICMTFRHSALAHCVGSGWRHRFVPQLTGDE